MASCFKKSCWIYWVNFILSLSYLFASQIFTERYIIETEQITRIQTLTAIICIFNIIYSIVGCFFIKCNIVHILCVACYIGPLVLVNFILNTYLAVDTQRVEALKPPQMLEKAINHIQKFGKYPSWLEYTQLYEGCCGIYGYMDYPAYFYPTMNPKGLEKLKLPRTCCVNFSERGIAKDCGRNSTITNNLYLNANQTINGTTWPEIYETMTTGNTELACPGNKKRKNYCASLQKVEKEDKYDPKFYSGSNDTVQFSPNLICIYNKCGCYRQIKDQKETLYGSAYLVFLITNYLSMIVEVVFYFKNYCAFRTRKDSSTHSLDPQTVSLLNLRAPKPGSM